MIYAYRNSTLLLVYICLQKFYTTACISMPTPLSPFSIALPGTLATVMVLLYPLSLL